MYHGFYKNITNQMFLTLIMTKKNSWVANQHIIMIFEASCDTEDWSNYAN